MIPKSQVSQQHSSISKAGLRRNMHAAISLGIRRKRARGGHHSDIEEGIMTRHDPGSIRSARNCIAAGGDGFPVNQEKPRQAAISHGLILLSSNSDDRSR
jgi:hypothetical protein